MVLVRGLQDFGINKVIQKDWKGSEIVVFRNCRFQLSDWITTMTGQRLTVFSEVASHFLKKVVGRTKGKPIKLLKINKKTPLLAG